MPILNLNGTERKNAPDIDGQIFQAGTAAKQHGTVRVSGLTYNSPFTESSISVFPGGSTLATQPQLPATQSAEPGNVVPVRDFSKLHPSAAQPSFNPIMSRPVVNRAGGPSPHADTPANPNVTAPRTSQTHPVRPVAKPPVEADLHEGFLGHGGGATLGGHANSSNNNDRWTTVKTGAAG